jgi:formate hydrogenlyase subunit 5
MMALAERIAQLPAHLGAQLEEGPPEEVRLRVGTIGFERASRRLAREGARFITLTIASAPERSLLACFALRGRLIVLRAVAEQEPIRYGSLGSWWSAARWAEAELVARGSVDPVGYEGPPAAREADALARQPPDADALTREVSGLDVFTIPYGPVRSGIFEAIQFVIETGGEDVLRLHTRIGFKHRGLEERMRGMAPQDGVYVAERIAGIASVAHACAYSQAIERALGVPAPAAAERWRVIHAELERIACHLDVVAKQADTTALYVGHARFQILKERIMRLRSSLCGSRFGRGVVVPGGVRVAGLLSPQELHAELDAFEAAYERDRELFERTSSMTDRLIGTGRLLRALVEEHCAVGPLARGSGSSLDARHERPYGEYRRLGLRVVTERAGDAMARVLVRFGEISESLRILRQAIDHLGRPDGELAAPLPEGGEGDAFGWAEAPQGEVVVRVSVRDGLLEQVHVASPSFRNWALFEHAFPTDVLTDFAFTEHSFGLTPAGADR